MSKIIKAYYPGKKFPAISVTGKRCTLNCPHCEGKYLRHMLDGSRDLYSVISSLYAQGIEGVLISGGCDQQGKVPIEWKEIKKIKREFDILINVHVGIISPKDVRKIASSDIDIISFDFIPSSRVLKKIYGIEVKEGWAKEVLREFEREGLKYAPHITIGLDWGKVWWEYKALEELMDLNFDVLVLNVLIPTKGTSMENVPPLPLVEFSKVLSRAKNLDAEISLGCMRPRGLGYEEEAIKRRIDRIVMPPRKLGKKFEIKERCCVL